MEPEKFWLLELYTWSLWIGRIKHLQGIRRQESELLIELERGSMALLANVNRGKDSPVYKPTDFYKLPYDGPSEEVVTLTGQDLLPILTERFKNKPIKNSGGN